MVNFGIVLNTGLLTTLPDGQRYEIIANQNTILETIVYNGIVSVLSLVNNIYMHSIVMCIVCYYIIVLIIR